jgi:hypothetical protein
MGKKIKESKKTNKQTKNNKNQMLYGNQAQRTIEIGGRTGRRNLFCFCN